MKHDEYLYKMWHTTWDQINENFETEQTLKTKVEGNIVSFEAFLKYILNGNYKEDGRSKHWLPIHPQCATCLVNYSNFTLTRGILEEN